AAGACDKTPAGRGPGGRSMAVPGAPQMVRAFRQRPACLQAPGRGEERARSRLKLPQEAAHLGPEVVPAPPRCRPPGTVCAFWTDADTRHHFKVFKPVAEVVPDDLPPAWLKNALIAIEGEGLECC